VNGDLFGATLGGDMLSPRQRRPPTAAGQADEIFGDQRDGTPRAPLPRRVGRRVDDNLSNHTPTGVVRIATCHEKPCKRFGDPDRFRIRPVAVQVPERGTHLTAVVHRPGEFPSGPPRFVSFTVDHSTVLGLRHISRHPSGQPTSRAACWG